MNRSYSVLSVRKQDEVILSVLRRRLDTILPVAMREAGLDMWIVLCQEDDHDPVFKTMIPMKTWTPILQMLIFFDRGASEGVEKINLSQTETADLYDVPWSGTDLEEQWRLLVEIVKERNPERIGINIGEVLWAGGGLTHNLYRQLVRRLPEPFANRLVSAEAACGRWLMTLSEEELEIYPSVVALSRAMIADVYRSVNILPGVTTTTDMEWDYWQRCADLGLEPSFTPHYSIYRSAADKAIHPVSDKIVRRGDVIHCDVGLKYLRLTSDHQELAYIRRAGETDAPEGLKHLFVEANRLQRIYMEEFVLGRTGNEMLAKMLARARAEGIPNPKVYSHSLGLLLHEPGPLIGLPWEQTINPGRGDVRLEYDTCYTMELSIADAVPEWGGQIVRLPVEQDVSFTRDGCRPIHGIQTGFHLV